MKRKLLFAALLAIALSIIVLPSALAVGSPPPNPITEGGTYDLYEYGSGTTLVIMTTEAVTLNQSTSVDLANFQIMCSIAGVNLTIEEIIIDNFVNDGICALSFTGADNTLTLVNDSILVSGLNTPGIKVEEGTSLEITGTGAVMAFGGNNAAGIGSGNGVNSGNIIISDCELLAGGGTNGAGIGGGNSGIGENIIISGGYIEATSDNGAAIGSGAGADGGNITISGGYIEATSDNGAAIGSGAGADGGNITISGGMIDALSFEEGAGIGGGSGGSGGTITITDGDILSESSYGAGIGGGLNGSGGTIKISEGWVEAYSYDSGAGIGGGNGGNGGNITISGGYATGCGSLGGAGIGGGNQGDGGTIIFSGGVSYAEGDYNDIGSGQDGSTGTINIKSEATVFLRYNKSDEITTSTHSLHTSEEYDGVDAYGHETPPWWDSGTAYAYINDYTGSKKGNLTGTLTDSDDNPLENYEVTIYSDPITDMTNSNGDFSFSSIPYSSHILTIRDSFGILIDQYNLYFTQGHSTSTSVTGSDINIVYRSYTTSIHLSFQGNAALDDFTFTGATFYGNPQTSEQTWWEWIVDVFNDLF